VPVPTDSDAKLTEYAHPERLVTTQWLADQLGTPGLVVVESDEDVLLYETGHIPGSVKVDWHTELNDQVRRDYLDGAHFAALLSAKGIGRDDTVVIYGDKNNWWAAYALWVFTLFGHADVRLLDGGRAKWAAEGRPMTTDAPAPAPAQYPVVERDDSAIRAFKDEVMAHLGMPLIDVRSPQEYTGEKIHMPDYPQEGALRGGHIPGPTARRRRGRHLQAARRAGGDLPGREGPVADRRRHRLLPDRRAVQPHLVRAAPPAGLPQRAQLRRFVDRVGQRRPSADRPGRGARFGRRVTLMPTGAVRTDDLPAQLAAIVTDFQDMTEPERLQLLLDFSTELPELPARLAGHPELMEAVVECQSPIFVTVEVGDVGRDGGSNGADDTVHLYFAAPAEAPTTRGFAGILAQGLDGLPAPVVLAVPDDVPDRLGLTRAVSPLRLRGMAGMLARIKRQVRERSAS
jgi:3-mercaptopyruvate sulfurtransferase SseA/sulfur transfer protein SufE